MTAEAVGPLEGAKMGHEGEICGGRNLDGAVEVEEEGACCCCYSQAWLSCWFCYCLYPPHWNETAPTLCCSCCFPDYCGEASYFSPTMSMPRTRPDFGDALVRYRLNQIHYEAASTPLP